MTSCPILSLSPSSAVSFDVELPSSDDCGGHVVFHCAFLLVCSRLIVSKRADGFRAQLLFGKHLDLLFVLVISCFLLRFGSFLVHSRIETKDFNPNLKTLTAILDRWPEFTMWLMTGKTIPDSGQISPEVEETQVQLKQGKLG